MIKKLDDFLRKTLDQIVTFSNNFLLFVLCVTVFMGYQLLKLDKTGAPSLYFPGLNKEIIKAENELDTHTEKDYLVLAFISGSRTDFYSDEVLSVYYRTVQSITETPGITGSLTLFNLGSLQGAEEKDGLTIPDTGDLPGTIEEVARFRQNLSSDKYSDLLVSGRNGKIIFALFSGNIPQGNRYIADFSELERYGTVFFESAETAELMNGGNGLEMKWVLLLTAGAIAALFLFFIRKSAGILTPLLYTALSLLWTIGFMAIFKIRLSPVNLVPLHGVSVLSGIFSGIIMENYHSGASVLYSKKQDRFVAAGMDNISVIYPVLAFILLIPAVMFFIPFQIVGNGGAVLCFSILSQALTLFFLVPAMLNKFLLPQKIERKEGIFLTRFFGIIKKWSRLPIILFVLIFLISLAFLFLAKYSDLMNEKTLHFFDPDVIIAVILFLSAVVISVSFAVYHSLPGFGFYSIVPFLGQISVYLFFINSFKKALPYFFLLPVVLMLINTVVALYFLNRFKEKLNGSGAETAYIEAVISRENVLLISILAAAIGALSFLLLGRNGLLPALYSFTALLMNVSAILLVLPSIISITNKGKNEI